MITLEKGQTLMAQNYYSGENENPLNTLSNLNKVLLLFWSKYSYCSAIAFCRVWYSTMNAPS